MKIIRLRGLIVSVLVVLYFTTLPIAALISVTTLAFTGTPLSSSTIFTVLLSLMTIQDIFCYNLSMSIQTVADATVALGRIQDFLEEMVPKSRHPEQQNSNCDLTELVRPGDDFGVQCKDAKKPVAVQLISYRKRDNSTEENRQTLISSTGPLRNPSPFTFSDLKEPYLSVVGVSCSWNQDHLSKTPSDITLNASNGDMLAVTGKVGSGKSSLLTAILGELPLCEGAISYHGRVAYVPQIPWVFSGTIRENILFGLPFNEEKFRHVIDICGLTKDLTDFSNGDLTEIGQRGATLSGGQKARVGLARAVYSDADIYLLDDPLSAVDTKVARRIFESCIVGHLSGRIRLLVTHQLQHLKDLDHIAVMENGSVIYQGGYTELTEQGVFSDILELTQLFKDDPERGRKNSVYEVNEKGTIMKVINRPRSVSSVSAFGGHDFMLPEWQDDDNIFAPRGGLIARDAPPKRQRSVNVFEFSEKKIIKRVAHRSLSTPVSFVDIHGDKGRENPAFLSDLESSTLQETDGSSNVKVNENSSLPMASTSGSEADKQPVLDMREEEEGKMAGTVTWRLYWKYFKEGYSVPMIVLLIALLMSAQGKLMYYLLIVVKLNSVERKEYKYLKLFVLVKHQFNWSSTCRLFYLIARRWPSLKTGSRKKRNVEL